MCSPTVASASDGVKGVGLDSAAVMRERQASSDVRFAWRGDATDEELVTLTQSHGGEVQAGWWDRIRPHSLGWVTARIDDGTLVGFVNVAWDGGDHAFLIDTKVRPDQQRRGIGTKLVRIAVDHAKEAGCEWIEVDFDEPLAPFYYDACGFTPTLAGLVHLPDVEPVKHS
jgi:ribosomal protein S18 acetylase RimI-like enzyme